MRRIPLELEKEALRKILQGATYRGTSLELGISLATIDRTVENERRKVPDFDTLRALRTLMEKRGLSVFDATRACRLVEILNNWQIDLDELEN